MTNLLHETIKEFEDNYFKWPYDVEWIEDWDGEIPIETFIRIADEEYDAGYGAEEVSLGLRIVLKNGAYLTRHEYDGAENWEWHIPVQRPERASDGSGIWTGNHHRNRKRC